jgi:hypothetical protein
MLKNWKKYNPKSYFSRYLYKILFVSLVQIMDNQSVGIPGKGTRLILSLHEGMKTYNRYQLFYAQRASERADMGFRD